MMLKRQTDAPHQLERVAFLDDSRSHPIVERDTPVFDVIFKVHIEGVRSDVVNNLGERQIVSGDKSHGTALNQRPYDRSRSDSAVVRVGAASNSSNRKSSGVELVDKSISCRRRVISA